MGDYLVISLILKGARPRKTITLEHLDGKLTVINFWGWPLPPKKVGCRKYSPFVPWRPP